MKKLFILILLVLAFNFGFSQQIAIPFRDGNKWGIANEKAEILIEPKFDSVEFYENYSNNYEVIISKVKNLKGLIINGKEILPPIYETIYEKGGKYIIIKSENNVTKTDAILPDGTSIFTKPIAEILRNENFSDRYQLFHVLNPDATESAFIFNPITNTISQWLYENYYSLDVMKLKSINTINFKVKKTQKDGLTIESWDFSKLPNEVKKSETVENSETKFMEFFIKKSYGKKGSYSGGSEGVYGDVDNVRVMEEIRGDRDYDVVMSVPEEDKSTQPKKQPVYISKSFKIENEKLVMITQNQYSGNNTKKTSKIDWEIPIKNIEIKGYSLQEKQSDTTFYYNNTVVYKKNGKTGFLYSENTRNKMEFDSITKNVYVLNSDVQGSDLVFMVANLDAKTKRYKYGFYSFKKKLLTPVKYDKLTATTLNYVNGEKSFIAQENGKFGLVSNAGKEILKSDNESIIQLQTKNSSDRIIQIKKDNKYSLIFQKYGNVIDVSSIKYDYPIKDVLYNYPNSKSKSITLLKLVDDEGKTMGYADLNGIKFYKN